MNEGPGHVPLHMIQENMEKQFSENRKDGYLDKKIFLEKSKQEEKDQFKNRKKVKG